MTKFKSNKLERDQKKLLRIIYSGGKVPVKSKADFERERKTFIKSLYKNFNQNKEKTQRQASKMKEVLE